MRINKSAILYFSFSKTSYLPYDSLNKDYCYPIIHDVPGFTDDDDERYQKEILRLFLYGELPDETDLVDVHRFYKEQCERRQNKSINNQRQFAIEKLREKFSRDRPTEKIKIDRVIFVTSAAEVLPRRLIKSVHDVCRKEKRSIICSYHYSSLYHYFCNFIQLQPY